MRQTALGVPMHESPSSTCLLPGVCPMSPVLTPQMLALSSTPVSHSPHPIHQGMLFACFSKCIHPFLSSTLVPTCPQLCRDTTMAHTDSPPLVHGTQSYLFSMRAGQQASHRTQTYHLLQWFKGTRQSLEGSTHIKFQEQ